MAEPKKTKEGTWRIQPKIRGNRVSGTFKTKKEAQQWAARQLSGGQIEQLHGPGHGKTLGDMLSKYAEEKSPQKKGWRWELLRINNFHSALPVHLPANEVGTDSIAKWKDARLKVVKPGTVLREISLLSVIFEVARREWKWIAVNPLRDLRKPASPKHRERTITNTETRIMLRSLGYSKRQQPSSKKEVAAHVMLFALSAGMRASEITNLTWDRVYDHHVHLATSKTGEARDVPLSPVGKRIIQKLKGANSTFVFPIRASVLDVEFREARKRAGLKGFTFHDTRHTAATRLALSGRLDAFMLCKIMGWKNTSQALAYFNPTVKDLAMRL